MLRASRRWPRAATSLLAATLMATGAMAAPAAATSHAATFTVNAVADQVDGAPGDGVCNTGDMVGDAPECTLRAAVMEADASTQTDITIQVPAGTYSLTIDGTTASGADGDLYLSDANKDADASYTIVGTDGTPVIDAAGLGGDDATDRILRIDDADGNGRVLDVTLSNLELTGGDAIGETTNGGAVLVDGDAAVGSGATTVLVEDGHAHANRAGYYGGAIASFDAELTVTNSLLEDNAAPDGGALYTGSQQLSILTVRDSEIRNNTATEGGAIWATFGDIVDVSGSTLSGNTATLAGGAIYNLGGTISVTDTAFRSNAAVCEGECGANGGAIWTSAGLTTAYIAGSSFVGNSAKVEGGALYIAFDDAYVTNSTFTDNEAMEGGAILNNGGSAQLTRTTVARNHATFADAVGGSGGGVRTEGGSVTFENTVVAANTVGDGALENCGEQEPNQLSSNGHNVSDDTTCFADGETTGDEAGVDAGLAARDTSGDTDVIPLMPSSPAIDIGQVSTDGCPVAEETEHVDEANTDQRDAPAPVDGDADGDIACDAGAFEFQPNEVTVQATTDGSEAGPTDGSVTLARTGDVHAELTVAYGVAGTATADSDYTALAGTATFAAGDDTTVVPVDVLDDDEAEDDETVVLTLVTGEDYSVGSPASGTVTIADDDVADTTDRLDGRDRIDTAVLVSQRSFPDGADVVVIARSDVYADALAGGPYAHQEEAPILVTPPTQLRDEVATEIERLGATRAVILGGPLAITPSVEASIEDDLGLTTTRLAGADRFATAADIADEVGGDHVYITEGDNPDPSRGWPDAVAVAPVAAHQNHPILFVRSDLLPEPTRAQLEEQSPSSATVIGGEVAVDAAVAAEVDTLVDDVDRVGGATRYHTSLAVAELGLDAGLSADTLWVARSDGWVDALVAGPAVARAGDSFVLVPSTDLDIAPVVRAWIADRADTIDEIVVTGGPVAISDLVVQQLDDLIN